MRARFQNAKSSREDVCLEGPVALERSNQSKISVTRSLLDLAGNETQSAYFPGPSFQPVLMLSYHITQATSPSPRNTISKMFITSSPSVPARLAHPTHYNPNNSTYLLTHKVHWCTAHTVQPPFPPFPRRSISPLNTPFISSNPPLAILACRSASISLLFRWTRSLSNLSRRCELVSGFSMIRYVLGLSVAGSAFSGRGMEDLNRTSSAPALLALLSFPGREV